jgi:hypothetical protein
VPGQPSSCLRALLQAVKPLSYTGAELLINVSPARRAHRRLEHAHSSPRMGLELGDGFSGYKPIPSERHCDRLFRFLSL